MTEIVRASRGGESRLDHSTEPLAVSADLALLDLDGVVYRGPHAVPHAAAALAQARASGLRLHYVTNNAGRPPQQVADHLTELGIPTGGGDVTTAAQAAAAFVEAGYPPGTKVLIVGAEGLVLAMEQVGMVPVTSAEDSPAVVVQGLSRTLAWPELAEAAYAIGAGAAFIASNLDSTLPTERGMAPGNGAMVAALTHATGVTPRATGKPQPGIFHQAATRSHGDRPLVVGDRLDTDIAGANAAGYPAMHVLTGVDGPAELLRARPDERPTLLATDLRGLVSPHPPVVADGEGWRCRQAVARVRDGRLELTERGNTTTIGARTANDVGTVAPEADISLDGLRAACVAAWTDGDTGLAAIARLGVRD